MDNDVVSAHESSCSSSHGQLTAVRTEQLPHPVPLNKAVFHRTNYWRMVRTESGRKLPAGISSVTRLEPQDLRFSQLSPSFY